MREQKTLFSIEEGFNGQDLWEPTKDGGYRGDIYFVSN